MTFLVYSTEQIETFLEAKSFQVFFMSELSSFDPHDSFLLESAINLIVPVLLIVNSINCVILSVADYIGVYLIIVEMLVINSVQDLCPFDNIEGFVQDPFLALEVKEAEVV
jgi:hypothetical protein